MDERKLKPCPFCGRADGLHLSNADSPRAVAMVYCTRCGAEGPGAYSHQPFHRKPSSAGNRAIWDAEVQRAIALAVELWNERRPS